MIKKLILSTIGAFFLLGVPGAMAINCTSTISFMSVKEVKVPPGAGCELLDVTVTDGNIQADKASFLIIQGGTVVNGDVQAVETNILVDIDRLRVLNGNIQIEKTNRAVQVRVHNTNFVGNGDIQVSENDNAFVSDFMVANGNIQVEKNGFATVKLNSASGDIQCFDNGTLTEANNIAGGNLECVD